MNYISAFADEIGDDPREQIKVLESNGVGNIELRGAWGKNVLDFTADETREIASLAADHGIGFSAVGSPLGKAPITDPFETQLAGLERAITCATTIGAPYIRVFSFYLPEGDDPAKHRTEVIDRLSKMAEIAGDSGLALAHENEKRIYGDIASRVLDLHESIDRERFVAAFDFANYLQCGQRPYEDCWTVLRPYVAYFHIKDATDGSVRPAGEGDGQIARILTEAFADGYRNFLTLEPHLSQAGEFFGRTTPDLFDTAVAALRKIGEEVPGVIELFEASRA